MQSDEPEMTIARRLIDAGWVANGRIIESESHGKAQLEFTTEGAEKLVAVGAVLRILEGEVPLSPRELDYLKQLAYACLAKAIDARQSDS